MGREVFSEFILFASKRSYQSCLHDFEINGKDLNLRRIMRGKIRREALVFATSSPAPYLLLLASIEELRGLGVSPCH